MALNNLISIEITPAEELQATTGIASAITAIEAKMVNLTPSQRQEHGRISYETEDFIDRIDAYMTSDPMLIPNYIDVVEFRKDIAARKQLKSMLNEARKLLEMIEDTSMLLSSDIYQTSISFYRAVKIAAQQNVPGSTGIYQDLQHQFPGRPKKQTPPTP